MKTKLSPLISVKQLCNKLDNENLVILDASIPPVGNMQQPQQCWPSAIIQGARRFDINNGFSDEQAEYPHTMPSEAQFIEKAQALGINKNSEIVVYDSFGIFSSARAWWMFKAMGHKNVTVLNGGLPQWIKEGLPLASYAENILIISEGNHENSIKNRHEIDLLAMLGDKLNCNIGSYDGWIKLTFKFNASSRTQTYNIYYNHGGGGNSPVTVGVIGTNRRQVNINADIFLSGHDHNKWKVSKTQRELNQRGIEQCKQIVHLDCSTYKKLGEWEKEKGFPHPTLGGWFGTFYVESDTVKFKVEDAQ